MTKRAIIGTIAATLAIVLPFLAMILTPILTPPVYDEWYHGELAEMYDRLYSVDEPKIVVIGGSNIAFGLNSRELSEQTGMPVVNFGLYAALGSKLMLDLARDAIGKGDIVVFAPETDPQAWSLYFSARQTLQALDSDYTMLFDLETENLSAIWGNLWSFGCEKLKYLTTEKIVPTDIYKKASFNEYCDLTEGLRPGLVNKFRRDKYDKNNPITINESILEDAFVDYLNAYIKDVEEKGATFLLSFSPMNRYAVEKNLTTDAAGESVPVNTAETIAAYVNALEDRVNCPLISDPDDYIMEPTLFYDSNFHLNDVGVPIRTAQLAADLAPYLPK